jgi:hypothetical protein
MLQIWQATKKKALPKFGDWDLNDPTGGTPFTAIFDEARNEKKGAMPADKTSLQRNASSPIDEDLYKQQSSSHKKYGVSFTSGFQNVFCHRSLKNVRTCYFSVSFKQCNQVSFRF